MELELRNYQLEQLEFLIDSDDNSCVQSPTGTGKSVVIAAYVEYLLKMGKQRIAIITPRKELVKNLKKYFGNRATMAFTNEKPNLFAPILITTFQSANKYMKLYNPDHYISDECFVKGTLIDGKPIETLLPGQYVNSWDEKTGDIKKKKILATSVKHVQESDLLELRFSNGVTLNVTKNHPFYTLNRGWINAEQIVSTDKLPYLSKRIQNHYGYSKEMLSEVNESLLHSEMWISGKNDISTKSDEFNQNQRKNDSNIKTNKTQTENTRWKRQRFDNTSNKTFSGFSQFIEKRRLCRIHFQNLYEKGFRLSQSLQDRFGNTRIKISNRNRWDVSFCNKKKGTRQEKREFFDVTRLVSSKIYKQTNFRRFENSSRTIEVYNLEIEDYNTYFAEGILVHNCHLSVTKTWCKAIDEGVRHDGFTATPMRYDGRKLRTHYSKLYKSQPIQWFIDNGYLSEVNIHQAEFDDPVRVGYYYSQKDDLMKQYEILGCKPKIDETVDLYLSKHKGEKSLFFVTSEGHGVDLEEALCRKGVRARFLTHKTSNKRRDNDFQAFAKDGLDCLINMELFTTGIDVPNCLNVFACRFTKSVALLFQMFGRGTRKSEGKIYNYYDLAGNHYYHDYDILTFNAWSLDNLDEEILMSASPRNRDSGGVYVKYEGNDEFIGLTSNLFEKKKKAQDTFSRKTIKSILQCGNMGYREKIMEICFADVAVEHKVYGLRVLKISEDNIKQYLSI